MDRIKTLLLEREKTTPPRNLLGKSIAYQLVAKVRFQLLPFAYALAVPASQVLIHRMSRFGVTAPNGNLCTLSPENFTGTAQIGQAASTWKLPTAGLLDIRVKGGFRDAHEPADFENLMLLALVKLHGQPTLLRIKQLWPSPLSSSGLCRSETRHRPLPNEIPLELRERTEDVEEQPAPVRGGVNRLLKAAQADLPLLHGFHVSDKVLERPAQAVESPDDKGVIASGDVERPQQTWPLRPSSAHPVLENPFASGFGQRIELQVEVLIVGRDAGVADEHGADSLGKGFRQTAGISAVETFPRFLATRNIEFLWETEGLEQRQSIMLPALGAGHDLAKIVR